MKDADVDDIKKSIDKLFRKIETMQKNYTLHDRQMRKMVEGMAIDYRELSDFTDHIFKSTLAMMPRDSTKSTT